MRNRSLVAVQVVLFVFVLFSALALQAQWTPGGNSTSNDISRTGKVGVMTAGTPSSQFHVFTATSMDGIAVDGSNNPAINFRSSGSIKGYLGLATAANAFFTGSAANDVIFRSEVGRILMGQVQASGAPILILSGAPATATAGDGESATEADLTVAPLSAHASGAVRIAGTHYVKVPLSNTVSLGELRGGESDAENYGSGSISILKGSLAWAYNANASANIGQIVGNTAYAESDGGTVGQVINLHSWSSVQGGTVGSQYGMYLQASNAGGSVTSQYGIYDVVNGGTVTNRYGLFLHTGAGSAANDYAIYQDTATSRNYFAGPMTIGSSTGGAYNLNVFGAAAITTGPDALLPRLVIYDDSWNANYVTYGVDAVTRYKTTGTISWNSVPVGTTRMSAAGTQTMALDTAGNLAIAGQLRFSDGSFLSSANGIGGSVTAAAVSAGTFGGSSGGDYSFPGHLSIGTTTQAGVLNVVGGANGWAQFQRSGKLLYVNANYSDANAYGFLGMRGTDGMGLSLSSNDSHPEYLFINPAGNVAIGATGATFKTEITHSSNTTSAFNGTPQFPLALINNDPTVNNYSFISFASAGGGSVKAGIGAQYRASNVTDLVFGTHNGTGVAEKMRIDGAGNVGIGTPLPGSKLDVVGDIHASGAITGGTVYATYQDVAEWVPASADAIEPGTVVVLDLAKGNAVTASSEAYDTTVAGVVSEHPGLVLGKPGEGKAQIATTGRVKVKVDASKGAIRVGDLLVTSDVAGAAMKSEPMIVNGHRFHQPGTIIGKALEALPSGTGEILVLLSLQ